MRACREEYKRGVCKTCRAEITFSAEMMNIQRAYTRDQLICERSVNLYMQRTRTNFLSFFINASFAPLLALSLLRVFIIRSRTHAHTSFITYLLVRPAHNKSIK